MMLDSLSAWLRCPACGQELGPRPPLSLACRNGHSFDVNKRGYVFLLAPRTRVTGDTTAMLDARNAFLARGHYAEIADTIEALLPRASGTDDRILDAGCGTGYYLRRVLGARPSATALAMDLSPAAVARAVRGDDRIDGIVADVWAPLPVRTGSATSILNIFAPRNVSEFARVLDKDGCLLVVVPEPDHLRELRDRGLVLGLQDEKLAKLTASLNGLFELRDERRVAFNRVLTPSDVTALIGMGPSAHHRGAEKPSSETITVTVAVRALLFARTRPLVGARG